MGKLKLMTVLGTRPEIIRLSAVIKCADRYDDRTALCDIPADPAHRLLYPERSRNKVLPRCDLIQLQRIAGDFRHDHRSVPGKAPVQDPRCIGLIRFGYITADLPAVTEDRCYLFLYPICVLRPFVRIQERPAPQAGLSCCFLIQRNRSYPASEAGSVRLRIPSGAPG